MFNLLQNRIFKCLFVISLFAFYFSNSQVTLAQTTKTCAELGDQFTIGMKCLDSNGLIFTIELCDINTSKTPCSPREGDLTNVPGSEGTASTGSNSAKPSDTKTFCSDVEGFTSQVGCNVIYFIFKIILEVFAKFAQLTSYTFDWAVTEYILNIKDLFKDSGGADKEFVYRAWSMVRDVVNIVMFFSAMYVGVRYILGKEDLDFKKSIIKLGLFAVFVNFSFVVAKFLVDISNVFSLFIRANILEETGGLGISAAIMQYTGVSVMVQSVGNPSSVFAGFTSWQGMAVAILFLFVAFFVFAYATIAILLRAIILLMCVITSPLMFVANSFKSVDKINQVWRDNFFGQLLFSPVLMLMLWLSIGFLKQANAVRVKLWEQASQVTTSAAGSAVDITTSATAATGATLLAMLTLILAVYVSGKASGGIGAVVGNMVGGAVKNLGLNAVTGGAGFALRNTVGRAGSVIANSKWVKDKKENGGAFSKRMASGIALAGDKMASAKVTVGGKSSMSTNDKTKAAADVILKERDEFIKENRDALKNAGLGDQANKVKTKDQQKILEAMLKDRASEADKTKWKKEEDIKKSLGIGVDDLKMSKADKKLAEAELLRQEKMKKSEELRNKKERLDALGGDISKLQQEAARPNVTPQEKKKIAEDLEKKREERDGLDNESDALKKQMQDLESQASAKEKEVTSSLMYAAGQGVATAKESMRSITDPIVEISKGVAALPGQVAKSTSETVAKAREALTPSGNLSAGLRSKKSGGDNSAAPARTPQQQQQLDVNESSMTASQ